MIGGGYPGEIYPGGDTEEPVGGGSTFPQALTANATVSATLATALAFGKTLTATATATASFRRSIGKALTGLLSSSATFGDLSPPSRTALTVDDTTVTITYNEALQSVPGPSPSEFLVKVNGFTRSVASASASGTDVTLTLATGVAPGDHVAVTYTG